MDASGTFTSELKNDLQAITNCHHKVQHCWTFFYYDSVSALRADWFHAGAQRRGGKAAKNGFRTEQRRTADFGINRISGIMSLTGWNLYLYTSSFKLLMSLLYMQLFTTIYVVMML
jgi:hypothetical protein